MSKRLVKIGKAAKLLGTTPETLRKWESTGEVVPTRKTKGGTRYYDAAKLLNIDSGDYPTVGYARVSSNDQKDDQIKQQAMKRVLLRCQRLAH